MTETMCLVSRDGRRWEFTLDADGRYVHRTRYGNIYAIRLSMDPARPYSVARLVDGWWIQRTGKLGSRCLELPDGGEYTFPGWG